MPAALCASAAGASCKTSSKLCPTPCVPTPPGNIGLPAAWPPAAIPPEPSSTIAKPLPPAAISMPCLPPKPSAVKWTPATPPPSPAAAKPDKWPPTVRFPARSTYSAPPSAAAIGICANKPRPSGAMPWTALTNPPYSPPPSLPMMPASTRWAFMPPIKPTAKSTTTCAISLPSATA